MELPQMELPQMELPSAPQGDARRPGADNEHRNLGSVGLLHW